MIVSEVERWANMATRLRSRMGLPGRAFVAYGPALPLACGPSSRHAGCGSGCGTLGGSIGVGSGSGSLGVGVGVSCAIKRCYPSGSGRITRVSHQCSPRIADRPLSPAECPDRGRGGTSHRRERRRTRRRPCHRSQRNRLIRMVVGYRLTGSGTVGPGSPKASRAHRSHFVSRYRPSGRLRSESPCTRPARQ